MAAGSLRVAIFLVPLALGFTAGAAVARLLDDPRNAVEVVVWWVSVVTSATLVATFTDRAARRLLPLTVLLRMTMLFPDRAPSRLRVARRSGRVADLRRRVAEAQERGDTDAGEMAELILSLAAALSQHDRKTRGHSERTRAYTDMLAEEMRLPQVDRDKLRWAALLHDVGKLDVPAEILNKDGSLTEAEWQVVKRHPLNGMKLISPLVPWLGDWARTVEHHHERWDGTGYPHGLAGRDIALGARIVAVADAYDVMTSGRSYQTARTPEEARREIADQAGRQFDPSVARALLAVSLGRLRWATGPLATLAEIPFLRGLPQIGRDVATVLTSSTMMATSLALGAIPAPVDLTPTDLAFAVVAAEAETAAGTTTVVEEPTGGSGGGGSGAGASTGERPVDELDGEEGGTGIRSGGGGDESGSTGSTTTSGTSPPPSTNASTTTSTAGPTSTTNGTTAPTSTTTSTTAPTSTTTSSTTTSTTTTSTTPPGTVTANADSATVAPGGWVFVQVLDNDTGPTDQRTVRIVSSPSNGGGAEVGASGKVRYQSPDGFEGTDSFVYEVCGAAGDCDTATVTVQVVEP